MPPRALEAWNPFDTSDKKCFPDLHEALIPGSTLLAEGSTVVDISVLAQYHAVEIESLHPPDLGYLPEGFTEALEGRCQAWFDEQTRIKAARVRTLRPSCRIGWLSA